MSNHVYPPGGAHRRNRDYRCTRCGNMAGTGKPCVPTVLDLSTASAEDINAALRHWRGWQLAFDLPLRYTPGLPAYANTPFGFEYH